MATKKDIFEIENSISSINTAIADIRDSVIKALIGENVMLKDRVRKLEMDLAEAQQYQRRSNVVITGIPTNIEDEKVESTVIDIFKTIDVNVSPRDIEASYRIGRDRKKTIVRFVNRKDAEAALSSRGKLKSIDAARAVAI